MESAAAVLRHFEVDRLACDRAVDTLRPVAPALAARLPALLAAAADPLMALASWERLLEETSDRAVLASLSEPEHAGAVHPARRQPGAGEHPARRR